MSLDDIFDEYVTPENATKPPRRPARASGPLMAPASVTPIVPLAKRPEALELSAKLAAAIAPEPVPAPPPREPLRLPVGMHLDVAHEDYIADPGERPSLNASIAKVIIERSLLHAQYAHPRLGGGSLDDGSPAKAGGSVLHALILGIGQEIVTIEADSFRTKKAKEERDAAIAAGKLPMLADQYGELMDLAVVLRKRLADKGVSLRGEKEVTAIWERDGVLARCRFDHLDASAFEIDDLKFCASASPEEITRKMIAFGYDVQHASNVEGLETLIPEAAGRSRMRFVFVEVEPPHEITVAEPTGALRELGAKKWKRAKALWRPALEANVWPGYVAGIFRVDAPAWAVTKDSETQSNRLEINNANVPF
jgi:hypothetical protein